MYINANMHYQAINTISALSNEYLFGICECYLNLVALFFLDKVAARF